MQMKMLLGDRDKVYVLNPAYRLRHDVYRTVLFATTHASEGSSPDWVGFIHPLQAALLSFFTHCRSLGENLALLADFFCRPEDLLAAWVSGFIENLQPIRTVSPQGEFVFPKRVLVEVGKTEGKVRFDCLDASSFVWKKLDVESRRFYTGPLQVTLMLTNRCMTHCRYCYADTETQVVHPLTTGRILELADEASRMPVRQFNLMGGEIFLHENWKVILEKLVADDIAPAYLSTKIPFTPARITALQSSGFRGVVQVSLDACNASVLSGLLGVDAGYAERVWHGLQLLNGSGLDFQVATVLTTLNSRMEVLEELYERLLTLTHLRDWRIVPVSDSLTKDYRSFKNLKLSAERLLDIFDKLEQMVAGSPFPVRIGREVVTRKWRTELGGSRCFSGKECSALTSHLFILPDGKVTICEQLYWNPRFLIGDVTKDSLATVWNSPHARRLCHLSSADISAQSPCSSCKLFDGCFGYHNRCWADVIKAYGSECWDYPDPRCSFAPPFKYDLGYE